MNVKAIIAIVAVATVIGIVGIVLAFSPVGAKSAPALTEWTLSTDIPASPETASARIVEQGAWVRGKPTCSVKLTNHRSVESIVSVYVAAEALDSSTKYRSDLVTATNLVTDQSETIEITHFGFGSGEDIPLNQPFRCRVTGSIMVTP